MAEIYLYQKYIQVKAFFELGTFLIINSKEIIMNELIVYSKSPPDIGLYFKKGLALFSKSLPLFITGSLIYLLLSAFTFTFFAGPLVAGYMLLFVKKLRGEPTKITDMFQGFSRFISLVIAFYVVRAIVSVGLFFFVIPGLIFGTWFFFVELLILDKNIGLFEALSINKKMVQERGLWNFVIINVILVLLLHLGTVISFGLGFLLVCPYVYSIYVVMYEDSFPTTTINKQIE